MKNNSDNQQNTQSNVGKIKSGLRFTRFVLLFLMAVAAIVLIFSNRDKINMDNFKRLAAKIDLGISREKESDNSVIDFDYDSSGKIAVYKDGIARVTSENLVIMDNIGTQFQSVLTGFNTPALVTTDKYVMAFDRGGKRLIVTNSFTVLFDTIFEDNIVTATMNENGYIAVVTESEAYKNKLIVYNSSFKEVYRINSLSRYIVDAQVSQNNKLVAVSSLYVKDADVIPQINYYKLTSDESLWNCNYKDSVAVSIKTKNDGSICSIFEWGLVVLDSKGQEKFKYEFGNKILQSCYIDKAKYNVAVVSESISGNSQILAFTNKGKQICDLKLDTNVLSIDVYEDRMAVLFRDKICIYSISGKLLFERDNPNDATQILFSDKNSVMLVSSSSVVYNLLN